MQLSEIRLIALGLLFASACADDGSSRSPDAAADAVRDSAEARDAISDSGVSADGESEDAPLLDVPSDMVASDADTAPEVRDDAELPNDGGPEAGSVPDADADEDSSVVARDLAEMSVEEVAAVDCSVLDGLLDDYVEDASACTPGVDVCEAVYVESGCDCARGFVVTERFVATADAVRRRAAECGIDGEESNRVVGYCTSDAAPVDADVSCIGSRCRITWPQSCHPWPGEDAGR